MRDTDSVCFPGNFFLYIIVTNITKLPKNTPPVKDITLIKLVIPIKNKTSGIRSMSENAFCLLTCKSFTSRSLPISDSIRYGLSIVKTPVISNSILLKINESVDKYGYNTTANRI